MRQSYEYLQFLVQLTTFYTGYYATGYGLPGFSSNINNFYLDPISYAFYEYGIGINFHLDNVSCTGNETKLSECMYAEVGAQNCISGSDEAGVICTGEYQ